MSAPKPRHDPSVSDTRTVEDLRAELDATGWDWTHGAIPADRRTPMKAVVEATSPSSDYLYCEASTLAQALRMTLAAINAAKEANR